LAIEIKHFTKQLGVAPFKLFIISEKLDKELRPQYMVLLFSAAFHDDMCEISLNIL